MAQLYPRALSSQIDFIDSWLFVDMVTVVLTKWELFLENGLTDGSGAISFAPVTL
jgi:hypothetical protein